MRIPRVALLLFGLLAAAAGLAQETETQWLDVSIAVFDPKLPEDPAQAEREGIQPEVRRAEARYLPAYLKARLQETGDWGAVRLLPGPDAGAELMITGAILHSDGARLELAVQARDSSGRQWLDGTYAGEARDSVSLFGPGREPDPFDEVYSAILADLESVRAMLDADALDRLENLAFLRYGAALLPEAFGAYLERDEQGLYRYSRLPADDDPMRRRISDIRAHEYLFIDVVDEEYERYAAGVRPVYDLWRDYRREQLAESAGFAARQADAVNRFRQGSYYDLRARYDNYRWAKMQQQYLDELRTGFDNEIEPTAIDLEDRLYSLSGTIEEQYAEWREILRELLALERGE